MSTLDNAGLKNSSGTVIIGINNTYFPDASYSFLAYNKSLVISEDTTHRINDIFNTSQITAGLWYVSLSVFFADSPSCSAAITTNATNRANYGITDTIFPGVAVSPTTGYVLVAWNTSIGFGLGATNGVSMSCTINVPSGTTANIGAVIYAQTTNIKLVMTATRVGPPTPTTIITVP